MALTLGSSFQAVAPQSSGGLSKTIPVPSRHYHRATSEKPLAGARISLKDTFDIEGVRTTLSSRAWAELYPAAADNGPYVKHLLDQGAIIVGKTKTSQLLAGNEWVDFQSPSNPRGDQYQEPSGSSTGAAASLAGYPWLDYAIGGDSKWSLTKNHECYTNCAFVQLKATSESRRPTMDSTRFDRRLALRL